MTNQLLPPEERLFTSAQVATLDRRRDFGHTLLVMAGQFAAVTLVLLLWVGQDLSYSPERAHPIYYYFLLAVVLSLVLGTTGLFLRRGTPRID